MELGRRIFVEEFREEKSSDDRTYVRREGLLRDVLEDEIKKKGG